MPYSKDFRKFNHMRSMKIAKKDKNDGKREEEFNDKLLFNFKQYN